MTSEVTQPRRWVLFIRTWLPRIVVIIGVPWVAALWEARGVQRRAQNNEVRALAAFDEAAARYDDLGRPRDQARCVARMARAG